MQYRVGVCGGQGTFGPILPFDGDLIAAMQLSHCGHSLHRSNLMVGIGDSADILAVEILGDGNDGRFTSPIRRYVHF
jgi:hypothetical protein